MNCTTLTVLVWTAFGIGLFLLAYEVYALVWRRVPTITEWVQKAILHFTPNEWKEQVGAPTERQDG